MRALSSTTTSVPAASVSGGLDSLVAGRPTRALGAAVATRGLGVDGPIREHYLVGPLDAGVPEGEWRTEICWPVLRPPER